ncbi:MAG TPA: hypothetical protein VMW58_00540 [Anaerolineae bacterium]|nr:hypothetical protein [Anaerolineae bacterium]
MRSGFCRRGDCREQWVPVLPESAKKALDRRALFASINELA